jgi:mannose/cellobiose epimerase-like protein (N-acyl-D-glucosamine 2-epimerase family)
MIIDKETIKTLRDTYRDGLLLAWELTGQQRYARWHAQVHDWAYAHFPDPLHGEWFGYLLREGSVSTELKGTMWKSPYHLPPMQLMGWRICERLLKTDVHTAVKNAVVMV